tara:strand:- start:42 stop:311 length:270 start_codon:yes stop_codon:yes gene_type:complete
MSKLYQAKIDLAKIDKTKVFVGKKGKYIDVAIWVNDAEDNYGNIMSIQQSTKKEETSIYLGNGKEYQKQESNPPAETKKETEQTDDLPF